MFEEVIHLSPGPPQSLATQPLSLISRRRQSGCHTKIEVTKRLDTEQNTFWYRMIIRCSMRSERGAKLGQSTSEQGP